MDSGVNHGWIVAMNNGGFVLFDDIWQDLGHFDYVGSTRSKDKRNAEGKENQKNAFHEKVLTLPFTVSGIGNKVFSVLLVFTFLPNSVKNEKPYFTFQNLSLSETCLF
jgi:hypothetical protein